MTPSTQPAIRIANLFRRKLTTSWSEKEVRAYKRLVKDKCFENLDDLNLIERYYFAERQKGSTGIHRRDLYTFLNNYTGELDRATAWSNRRLFEVNRPKLQINHYKGEKEATPEEFQRIGQLAKEELERFRQTFRNAPQCP